MTGIVDNNGQKPLLLDGIFTLAIELADKTKIVPIAKRLPDSLNLNVEGTNVIYKNIKDMQTIKVLQPLEPIDCSAEFRFDLDDPKRFSNSKTLVTIFCRDSFGKTYSDTFHVQTQWQPTRPQELPRSDLSIIPPGWKRKDSSNEK